MSKDTLSTVAMVALVICAVILTSLALRKELFRQEAMSSTEGRQVQDWMALAAEGHVMGSPNAVVKVVVFSDFQCPYCKQARNDLESLRVGYPSELAVVYRHFPLESIHSSSFDAAVAAECAAVQGSFQAYHDVLFEHQDSIGLKTWRAFARAAHVRKLDEFDSCVAGKRFRAKVERDMDVAREIGVSGTPSLVVRGAIYTGLAGVRELERWVREVVG